jgi:fatty acid desaturase
MLRMKPQPKRPVEWPTVLLLAATYLGWGVGTMIWQETALLSVILTAVAITQFSSLQHEALHGHPLKSEAWNEVLVFPALMLFLPYRRFRDTHLQHHYDPALTDPYDDPESNFRDPEEWAALSAVTQAVLRWNNTLAGRMMVGPALSTWQFLRTDFAMIRAGNRAVITAWLMHLPGLVMVGVWLAVYAMMPFWAYLVAVYLALALLRIRTFLEHRAHDQYRARTVVVEDRGPLSLLFLNNNFHVVHHMHPNVAWYRLPALYAARKEHFLRRNEGYVYRNYLEVMRQHLWNAKDPVPHPMFPVKKPTPDDAA